MKGGLLIMKKIYETPDMIVTAFDNLDNTNITKSSVDTFENLKTITSTTGEVISLSRLHS
jgi:hypothetical protein